MRRIFKWTVMSALFLALVVSPALAKKAPVERVVVDGVTVAKIKSGSQMTPYYPATARVSRSQAEVVLAIQVTEDGKVGEVDLLTVSNPNLGFEGSAMDAVKAWRFHPALRDGEPIESMSVIRISFAPPTLNTPSGFVMSEVSTRPFGAATLSSNSYQKIADGYRTASHQERAQLQFAEKPPCSPSNKNECLYDRSGLSQYNQSRLIHAPSAGAQPVKRGSR